MNVVDDEKSPSEGTLPDTMILRFRDLSVEAGETIQRHSEIIGQKGSVWWGWWKKQGERIPVQAFQAFASKSKSTDGLKILLFDSGSLSLYQATLGDIHWDAKGASVATPDSGLTPTYYGQAKYLAWFQLRSIDRIPDGEPTLRNWSYSKVRDFFETDGSIFIDFYDKQIASFIELKHQERTIWFIRPFRATDAVHEIRVYESGRVTPSNFPTDALASKSNLLVWVSDPHFSDDMHRFPMVRDVYKTDLSNVIFEDLQQHYNAKEMAGLLITGDLTWKSSKSEFLLARQFMETIRSWSTLKYNSVVLCPGNHDLAFSDDPSKKGTAPTVASADAVKNFREFYEGWYSSNANEYLCSGRRFLLGNARAVEVVSLNSSLLQQLKGAFQGQGFIGDGQLRFASDHMNWHAEGKMPRSFRIVMLHHHVVPVLHRELPIVEQQSSTIYDAGALCKWIVEHEVDLVLHGHMHQPMIVKESRSKDLKTQPIVWHEFVIASLGSSGVQIGHTSDNRNSYGVLAFGRSAVELKIRQISPNSDISDGDKTICHIEIPYRS